MTDQKPLQPAGNASEDQQSLSDQLKFLEQEIKIVHSKAYHICQAIPESTLLVIDDANKKLSKLKNLMADFDYCLEHYQRLFEVLRKVDPEVIKQSGRIISAMAEGLLSAKDEEVCG